MKTMKVGMIGGEFMAKAHSLAMAAVPMFFEDGVRLEKHTIADIDKDSAKGAASKLGFSHYTDDWKTIINNPEIDIVDIVTPNHLHEEMAIAAAEAGKHIICEKPLGRNAEETARILEVVEKAGVKHMVAFNYRKTPAVALAKKYIEEGSIGKILNFRGTYLQDWSADPNSPLSWRFNKEIAGSGTLGDIGTHVLDLAHYLVSDIAEVNAITRTWVEERPTQDAQTDSLGTIKKGNINKGKVTVDDEVITLLKFSNGAIGSLEATRNAWGRHNFLTFEIHGEKGSLFFNYERRDELQVCFSDDPDDRRGYKTVYTGVSHPYGEGLWPIPGLGIGYSEVKIIEMHDFLSAIMNDKECQPSFKEGHRIAQVTDAILTSAENQQWTKTKQ
ncbi:Gfo/Idh/MocA family protein [Evansella cellulosilytica]|uniref:Oxidoreductase domain protein n=1 Tax=Evansella cellulosilytica (strain ATCC 21833 / DSM 2522 / FERM P-1141 / JCM 9156 / N-4) TaxID=649639 RepID=E6TVV1_EVAC2|nr:Gfo/Idh/MocA family oxidoreductase [Evansella cellulosilytica]ADU28660.1 oxidoreductase domain protein [Evansella cellulosilytica DSM 2522]